MASISGLFLLFVLASYVVLWRMFKGLKNKNILLEQQVQEKAELLSYAVINERRALDRVMAEKESKKQLLSTINYEIRTPLNGILGMVSLLDDTSLTAEQKEYNETIRGCGASLVTTLNDIFLGDALANSKVEIDKSTVEQKDFDLRNLLDDVFEVFAGATARSNLELVHRIDPLVPSQLMGDSFRMRQVLMNLVENAITFTREGEIFVKVDRLPDAGDLITLGFEIHDNGLGMSNDKIKLLSIDNYSDINNFDNPEDDNGLLISKRIIESMGGRLRIESIKGKGTITRFKLQFYKSQLLPHSGEDMEAVGGKRILLVEDNSALGDSLYEEFVRWGLTTVVAKSGSEAFDLLNQNDGFDLFVVEMQMPDMDGMTLSKLLHQKYASIPIILLTAGNDLESQAQCEIFSAVVLKPVKYQVLAQHIHSALTHKENGSLSGANRVAQKLTHDFAKNHPLRILIAEDNNINQKLALKVLGKLGYHPDTAQNGKEVLEEVSKINYDLILMDVQMPEMDGLEATRMIRLCLSVQPIIIAMTANTMHGDREECLQAGMDDYLSKPVRIEELVTVLERWSYKIKEKQ